jgi:RimK family alpha-L-glutamate ligase
MGRLAAEPLRGRRKRERAGSVARRAVGRALGGVALARRPDVFLAAGLLNETNASLLAAFRGLGLTAEWLPPEASRFRLAAGDVVLSRLDVRPTLDGVEPGLWELKRARLAGVTVLNGDDALLTSHDKLATALAFAAAGVRHPRTANVDETSTSPPLPLPVVLKPRFGSWGTDVCRCETEGEYAARIEQLRDRPWFRSHGVLVQELVEPRGYDLRLVVAAGRVIGAVERHARPGEWRTNVALGGRRRPALPDPRAVATAGGAAAAVGGDLVGVDLLPTGDGGYVVLEVNGAVDFTRHYSLDGGDVFTLAASSLAAAAGLAPRQARVGASPPESALGLA